MSRPDPPTRPSASSLWGVLESRQGCGRDAPGGIAALILLVALILLIYLLYS